MKKEKADLKIKYCLWLFLFVICFWEKGQFIHAVELKNNPDAAVTEEMPDETLSENSVVVVIDPGHGGENAGAIYAGYIEKTLTLNTAKAMKEELEKYENVRVYLTRDSDMDMELSERADFAKEKNADIVLSLHYNMSELHKLYGAECWISAYGRCHAVGKDFSSVWLSLMEEEGLYNRGSKTRLNSRGNDYYGIIRASKAHEIPAVIIEHCHLDQVNDKPYIDHNTWPQKYGVLDATAVAKYFGLKSEILGVDYGDEVHEATPIPDSCVKPDDTPPEWCEAEVFDVDEETGMITGQLSAYDPDSRILYYTVSFNHGRTYGEYYKFEPDEDGQVYFEVQAPNKKRTRLVIGAINLYGGMTESELLYVGRLTYLDDELSDGDVMQHEEQGQTMDVPVDLDEEGRILDKSKKEKSPAEKAKAIAVFAVWLLVFSVPLGVIGFLFYFHRKKDDM